jgi:hypothetical protein
MPVTIDKISARPMLHKHELEDIKDIDLGIITQSFYGITRQVGQTSSVLTRIGNMDLHKVAGGLPVQNAMRRCLLNPDGTVNYYLNNNDSTLKADGTAANLTGADGNVMVEIPEFYIQFSENVSAGVTYQNVLISAVALPDFMKVEKHYISAYEAALNRTTLKAGSVVNTTTDWRGGDNNNTNDANEKTLLGKPVTNLTRPEERTYSGNIGAGWCQEPFEFFSIWRWLFYIEYANTNAQLAVNTTPTTEGYRQGGLGDGITTANGTECNNFNSYNPFCPTGHTNSLGNNSGEKDLVMINFGGAGINRTFKVNSYRGIENPFGHTYKRIEGININRIGGQVLAYGKKGTSGFVDNTATGYEFIGLMPYSDGYILNLLFGNTGIILPKDTGGGATTGFCDYYQAPNSDTWKIPLFSSAANLNENSGLSTLWSNSVATSKMNNTGFRLCFKQP